MNHQVKTEFVKRLAQFLCHDSARKSMLLQSGKEPMAKEWAALRAVTPLQGWVDVDEAFEADLKSLATDAQALADIVPGSPTPTP